MHEPLFVPRPLRCAAGVLFALQMIGCVETRAPGLSDADGVALRALEEAYTAAWRSNDPDAVMATLAAEGPVILPDGLPPISGRDSIRAFWWPDDGSVTTVTDYRTTVDEIGGSGDVAYVRGRGELAFTWQGPDGARSEHQSRSVFLLVAHREEDGRWRMARRMWSNLGS